MREMGVDLREVVLEWLRVLFILDDIQESF